MRMFGKWKTSRSAALSSERTEVMEDVRRAYKELDIAQWRFHNALGQDHVDYAVYSLEAAEKKLDMLLRKAKALWKEDNREQQARGNIG
jgi:hypothetical protein